MYIPCKETNWKVVPKIIRNFVSHGLATPRAREREIVTHAESHQGTSHLIKAKKKITNSHLARLAG